jgi:hypothetical protein
MAVTLIAAKTWFLLAPFFHFVNNKIRRSQMRLSLLLSLIVLFSFTCLAMAADRIVVVAGDVPLSATDEIIAARLEGLGFEVEPHSQNEAQPVDTAGAAAVMIFETVSSGNISNFYSGIDIPFIAAETYMLDEMGFAPDNHAHDIAEDTVIIVDPDHPIAGGLDGEVKITTAPGWVMSTCDPRGDVQIVARVKLNNCVCIATYEVGAKIMDGSTLAARHVITFINRESVPVMTDDGWKLFDNSILWATSRLGTPVDSRRTLATAWGAIKAY